MTGRSAGSPIQSPGGPVSCGRRETRAGYVLLYPDTLTTVNSPANPVGYLVGPMVFAGFGVPLFHTIGWLGVVVGSRSARRRGLLQQVRATRKAPAGGDGVTVIPLDSITGVRTTTSEGIGGWWRFQTLLVTTADGMEYGFRGTLSNWQSYLTSALAERGRTVRGTLGGISVMPGEAG